MERELSTRRDRRQFRNELERLLFDKYTITWPLSGVQPGRPMFIALEGMHNAMRMDLFGRLGVPAAGAAGAAAAGAGVGGGDDDEEPRHG